MSENKYNAALNALLIDLNGSLLQYVGDAWPWSDASAQRERNELDVLIGRQREQIVRLTELLEGRGWTIEFGTYPTEYTDLHYVALDYLLSQLVENEEQLISEIERTINDCAGDPQAGAVLIQLLAEQREIVRGLEESTKSRSVGHTA